MYRAPEMLDRWQGFDVDGYQADMWMFGCVLYVLCTGNKHPFQFESNLAIMNAYYNIDETEEGMATISERLKDLIRAILVPDP